MELTIDPPGFRLCPLRAEDWPEIALLFEDPDYSWFPYRRSRTPAEARAYSDDAGAHWREHGFGLWAVYDGTGAVVGTVGCTVESTFPDFSWNLGIRLGRTVRGRRLALPLLRRVITALPVNIDHARVGASIEDGHEASLALFEQGLGMTRLRSAPHPVHGSMHVLVAGLAADEDVTS